LEASKVTEDKSREDELSCKFMEWRNNASSEDKQLFDTFINYEKQNGY